MGRHADGDVTEFEKGRQRDEFAQGAVAGRRLWIFVRLRAMRLPLPLLDLCGVVHATCTRPFDLSCHYAATLRLRHGTFSHVCSFLAVGVTSAVRQEVGGRDWRHG